MSDYEFKEQFFSAVPNKILNFVLKNQLKQSDVFFYCYLLSLMGVKSYTFRPTATMASDVGKRLTFVKDSLARLLKVGVIERKRTTRMSKTTVLIRHKAQKK